MVESARARGEVLVVHTDREAGVRALEPVLLGQGIALSTTQGRRPQTNGLAEQAGGQLCRMAHNVLAPYAKPVAVALWQCAMV